MQDTKQVDTDHYQFQRYIDKARWMSLWHQLDEIARLKPRQVLEIGPGAGLFASIARTLGLHVETLDMDPDLKPDHVAPIREMPFAAASFDAVCAFQVLEHLPYEDSLQAFQEMVRVSRRHVVISLPDAMHALVIQTKLSKLEWHQLLLPLRLLPARPHQFDGQHYWEVEKKNYSLQRITRDLSRFATLSRTYRVAENPYHRFFVFETASR